MAAWLNLILFLGFVIWIRIIIGLIFISVLYKIYNRSNRNVAFFFDALRNDDTTLSFPENTFVQFLLPFKDEEFFYFCIGFLITFIMMFFRMLLYKIKAITKLETKKNK
jgi:hypothetical protein